MGKGRRNLLNFDMDPNKWTDAGIYLSFLVNIVRRAFWLTSQQMMHLNNES